MPKDTIKSLFLSPAHQLGWALSTAIIILILAGLGLLEFKILTIILLYIVIMYVDIVKHLINLQ